VKGKLEFQTRRSPDSEGRIFSETVLQIYAISVSNKIVPRNFNRRFANIRNLTELGGTTYFAQNGCCYSGQTDYMVERKL
jgi:hypothetical protein